MGSTVTASPDAARLAPPDATLVMGTRASMLALVQTGLVEQAIGDANPGLTVTRERITTKGDLILDRPLAAIDGKGLFVAEIEQALRERRIDVAVHSAKDLPSDIPDDMAIPVFTRRLDARDVLVSKFGGFENLPVGARVGTSSPRRLSQLRALRPDLTTIAIRGNVDTRLRKLDDGEYDGIVLAAAGLQRLGLIHRATYFFSTTEMVPSVGQGALALETRAGDSLTWRRIRSLDHRPSHMAVTAEREFLSIVGGGCSLPVAAYAEVHGESITVVGFIGALDGRAVRHAMTGPAIDAVALAAGVARGLLETGGADLLAAVRSQTEQTAT